MSERACQLLRDHKRPEHVAGSVHPGQAGDCWAEEVVENAVHVVVGIPDSCLQAMVMRCKTDKHFSKRRQKKTIIIMTTGLKLLFVAAYRG